MLVRLPLSVGCVVVVVGMFVGVAFVGGLLLFVSAVRLLDYQVLLGYFFLMPLFSYIIVDRCVGAVVVRIVLSTME